WWLLSEVARSGDTDYTYARMINRANEDLANNIGNLVNRTVSMIHRYRHGTVPAAAGPGPDAVALGRLREAASATIAEALGEFDFRRAVDTVTAIGDEANRYVEGVRPWDLAKAERTQNAPTDRLNAVLAELIATCRDIAHHLAPFLPTAASRITVQCGSGTDTLPQPQPAFPRLETASP